MPENDSRHTLSMLSHEMRTPLQSIEMICDLVAKDPDLPVSAILDKLGGIQRSCASLIHLLDETDRARTVPSEKSRFIPEEVSIRFLTAFLHEQLIPLATKEQRELVIELNEAIPERLWTHPVWLEQILRNLLINALRHGLGTVRLAISLHADTLRFAVSDEGPGIPPHLHKEIFKPRTRIPETSGTGSASGMGLGLSFAMNWSTRIGGTLTLDSRAGSGSIFTLSLPMRGSERGLNVQGKDRSHESINPPVQTLPDPELPAEPTLLLVDDNRLQTDLLVEFLSINGYTVLVRDQGRDALNFLESRTVHVIILDHNLPDISGPDLAEQIMNRYPHRSIPYLFYSGERPGRMLSERAKTFLQASIQKKSGSHRTLVVELDRILTTQYEMSRSGIESKTETDATTGSDTLRRSSDRRTHAKGILTVRPAAAPDVPLYTSHN